MQGLFCRKDRPRKESYILNRRISKLLVRNAKEKMTSLETQKVMQQFYQKKQENRRLMKKFT